MRYLVVLSTLFLALTAGCIDGDGHLDPIGQNSTLISLNDVSYALFGGTDMKLRAAAGVAVVSPSEQNHPCTMFLGGTSQNRLATGVHDDLEARALVLSQGNEYLILVSLDLVGWTIADVSKVHDALEAYGVDRNRVILSSSHTHAGPDTMGIWGENLYTSGRCPAYVDFLVETVVDLVVDTAANRVSVTASAAEIQINEPGASHPNLNRDSRYPKVFNDHLTVARFNDASDETVATLVNWHTHPEVLISSRTYSADFPRWTRLKLEQELGGTCVYVTGTLGGLTTPLGISVPERTEQGEPVLVEGQPVFISNDNETKMWSLGYVVGEWVLVALEDAQPLDPQLSVRTAQVDLPLRNPAVILLLLFGVLEMYDVIDDNPAFCGLFGCLRQTLHHAQLGSLHFFSLPGEAYSETSVGRPASVRDWGEPWGEHAYPAIEGYRERLPEGHLAMDIGLANNEIGYMTPFEDFHAPDHPDFYEEIWFFSWKGEAYIREAIFSLID